MTGRPTGLVLASLLVIASASVMLASFQYVLVEMQLEFSFSTESANALAFMPSAASLLVVFVVGSLADRWGPRRVLLMGIALFLAGGVFVSVAPTLGFVPVGRVLDGVGGVTMAIVALAVINSSVREGRTRAQVFGLYAAVTPATFMIAPPVAAVLVAWAGWRACLVPGIVLGVLAFLTTMRYVPERAEHGSGELLTQLLAGLALAGLALGVTTLPIGIAFSVIAASITVIALLTLAFALRRVKRPTLDVGWCRQRRVLLLLVAMGLAAMPNLFFYTNLLLQYRYGAPLLVVALLLVVPQACAGDQRDPRSLRRRPPDRRPARAHPAERVWSGVVHAQGDLDPRQRARRSADRRGGLQRVPVPADRHSLGRRNGRRPHTRLRAPHAGHRNPRRRRARHGLRPVEGVCRRVGRSQPDPTRILARRRLFPAGPFRRSGHGIVIEQGEPLAGPHGRGGSARPRRGVRRVRPAHGRSVG